MCPPCDCGGGGYQINGGGSFLSPLAGGGGGGGSYATSPIQFVGNGGGRGGAYVGPQLVTPAYRSERGREGFLSTLPPTRVKRGSLYSYSAQSNSYSRLSSHISAFVLLASTRDDLSDADYDDVLPTSEQQVSDVSVDSKKLVPYDVYLKRNRFLKQLRVGDHQFLSRRSFNCFRIELFANSRPNLCRATRSSKSRLIKTALDSKRRLFVTMIDSPKS